MNFTQPSHSQTRSKSIIASPFFMFLADQQKIIKDRNSNIKLLDFVPNALKEWDQTMSIQDEYTAKFVEESEKIEAALTSIAQTSVSNQSEMQISYDVYGNDFREQTRRENPHLNFAGLSKLLGEMWKALDQQTKSHYEAKSKEARALYEQQVAHFEAKHGKVETYRKAKKAGRKTLGSNFQISSHQNLV